MLLTKMTQKLNLFLSFFRFYLLISKKILISDKYLFIYPLSIYLFLLNIIYFCYILICDKYLFKD